MTSTVSVDKLARVYRKIRAAIEEREAAHQQEIGQLKQQLDVVSSKLLELCNELNVDSLKTPDGTVLRRKTTRYWTSDWSAMYDFIKEHDAFHLLERRVHNANMQQFLEENPDAVPAGLNAETKYTITVRKPTNR